jgi:hypothetical protein
MPKTADKVREAWQAYLDATRSETSISYDEVEPWAWNRLQAELKILGKRTGKIRPAAAA